MRLIDADEIIYGCGFDNGYGCEKICHCDNCTYHMVKEFIIKNLPTINAIPIPEDATNGDVIKIMFPNFEVKIIGDTVIMETHYPHPFCKMQFDIRYWNTLYKAESEE